MRKISLMTVAFILLGFGVQSCSDQNAKAKPNLVVKDPPSKDVVAKINGQNVSLEELIGEAKVEYIKIKKDEYKFKMERLNALIQEKLVGAEAKKAGMPVNEYIDKKVAKGIKVSDKDFNRFVETRKISQSRITPPLKEKIMTYLKEEKKKEKIDAHLAKLTKKNPVEVYFAKPKMNIQVAIGKAPTWGKEDAPVQIVEFSDFQCPYCERAAKTVDELKKKYGKKIRLAFKHFPLSFHKDAEPAAQASMCVNEQNSKKFWKFHDLAFNNQKKLDLASLEGYAKTAGADIKKYKECMDSKKYASFVKEDLAYGEKLGVRSTPTFFINGELVAGALPYESFAEAVDEALEDVKQN